jgi:hypothetical protein
MKPFRTLLGAWALVSVANCSGDGAPVTDRGAGSGGKRSQPAGAAGVSGAGDAGAGGLEHSQQSGGARAGAGAAGAEGGSPGGNGGAADEGAGMAGRPQGGTAAGGNGGRGSGGLGGSGRNGDGGALDGKGGMSGGGGEAQTLPVPLGASCDAPGCDCPDCVCFSSAGEICTQSCDDSTDCPTGSTCSFGNCLQDCPSRLSAECRDHNASCVLEYGHYVCEPNCESDDQCPELNHVCVNQGGLGWCLSYFYTSPLLLPNGASCLHGACARECIAGGICASPCDPSRTGHCPDGGACYRTDVFPSALGVCLPPCSSDSDCRQDEGQICSDNPSGHRVCCPREGCPTSYAYLDFD